jgi:hypothetical protein
MLATALRRNILDKHEPLEPLLDGREYYVKIKAEKTDELIFLSGRGPRTSQSISKRLQ